MSTTTRESVQTYLAGNVPNSVQSQFNELLLAAIPTITQSVVTALQQSGIISNTIQTQSDPQCRAQSGDTVQSLTISQNDTQTAALPHISTANIRDQTGTAITQDSQSTVNTRNVQVISLPGSTDIPRTDFSPSVNHQPTSVNPLVPLQTIGTTTYSPGTHVLDNLMSGTGMNPQNTCNYNANNSGRPLTLDVDSKTKAQIWANEFVSFDLLLPKKELKEIKYKFQDREGEGGPGFVKQQFMTSKVVNMAQWLEAFHIFVATVQKGTCRDQSP
jgi:hypothetical protein